MITRRQAETATVFHEEGCTRTVGPRGGVTTTIREWRRNGATRTWKTRPDEFQVPVKFGLKSCGYIDHNNANWFHTPEDCPLRKKDEEDV